MKLEDGRIDLDELNKKLFENFMDFANMIFRSSYYKIYEINSSIIDAYVNIMECSEEDKKILEEFFLNKKGE